MIFSESYVAVLDNSGVRVGKCLRVYGKVYGTAGDIVLLSVKQYVSNKKIEKGDLFRGVLVKIKRNVYRKTGHYLRANINAVVLIKKEETVPIGKRIKTPVFFELRKKGFSRLLSMAPGIF